MWQAREYGGMNPSPNQAVQRTGVSRLARRPMERQWRLAPVADLGRSAIVPYVMSCGHRIMFTESWAGETVRSAVPLSDPRLARFAPGLSCQRRGVPQNDSVDMILCPRRSLRKVLSPNQAARANVGERRSAACSSRAALAALPAMAQLSRSPK